VCLLGNGEGAMRGVRRMWNTGLYVYVCMYVCMYVCICVSICVNVYVQVCVFMCIWMWASMCVCKKR